MGRYWKSIVDFLIIYVAFWIIMWGLVIPSQMIMGGPSFYYESMYVWIGGAILLPVLFLMYLYLKRKKED